MRQYKSAAELLAAIESPGFASADQWQAQTLARILLEADVYVRADGLTDEQITQALLKPCKSIEETVASLMARREGRPTSICVLPEGPVTIAYVREKA